MRLPQIQGLIRRRLLLNFRVDRDVIQRELPPKFQPKLHQGSAIAGICLIRLEEIRPAGFPSFLGVSSENAAHRIAVTWQGENGSLQEGVFIPRRDTNSRLNHFAGGRVFPGEHHAADFEVEMSENAINFQMKSKDSEVAVEVRARVCDQLPASSKFKTVSEASAFFEAGALGYSATSDGHRLDGLLLKTKTWKIEPLEVERIHSSYFSDENRFPKGSVAFDCGLLMRNIQHGWHSAPDLYS